MALQSLSHHHTIRDKRNAAQTTTVQDSPNSGGVVEDDGKNEIKGEGAFGASHPVS